MMQIIMVEACKSLLFFQKTAIVALSILDTIRHSSGGFSISSTKRLKGTEFAVRTCDFIIQGARVSLDIRSPTFESMLRIFEKNIVSPLAGFLRVTNELTLTYEKEYLEALQRILMLCDQFMNMNYRCLWRRRLSCHYRL